MISPALRDTVVRSIDSAQVVALGSKLIAIPSFTTEETPVARFLRGYLEENGIPAELHEVDPGRFQVIGRIKGSGGGPSLMFNGHIDIDPLVEGGTRAPFSPIVEGDRLYGQGIFNMKGGVTAMVNAAVALRRAAVPLKGDLVIACVVGELQGGYGTAKLLESGLRTDYAVVTEPSGAGVITTTHCGVVHLAVHVLGFSQHISRKENGIDAIQKMVRVIDTLNALKFAVRPRPDLPAAPRLLVGSIIGGRGRDYELRGPYGVSDFCTILVDVRFLPGQTVEDVKRDIVAALDRIAASDADFKYEIAVPPGPWFKGAVMPMPAMDVPTDASIVKRLQANYRTVAGKAIEQVGAVEPMCYSNNDGSRLAAAGIECCRYGPGDGIADPSLRYHIGRDQFISISDMVTVSKVLGLTALDICG
ncbi:MAG: M20 family metallopeptidase [Alphaproteobacteria bacterium]